MTETKPTNRTAVTVTFMVPSDAANGNPALALEHELMSHLGWGQSKLLANAGWIVSADSEVK